MAHNKLRLTGTAPDTPPPPPPPLSKADRQRLRLYLNDCHEDPTALARACGMDELDILDWLDSPQIRRYLALRDEFRERAQAAVRRLAHEQAFTHRAWCLVQLKLALDRAIADGRSQTSLRRAAQAYLRALQTSDPEAVYAATNPKLRANNSVPPATPPSPSSSPSPTPPPNNAARAADQPSPPPPPPPSTSPPARNETGDAREAPPRLSLTSESPPLLRDNPPRATAPSSAPSGTEPSPTSSGRTPPPPAPAASSRSSA